MKRLLVERTGPLVLVHRQRYDPQEGWLSTNTWATSEFEFVEWKGVIKVWIKARFRSVCNDKDCGKAIEIGDRAYIEGAECCVRSTAKQNRKRNAEGKSNRGGI